jgi:S-(hydroxymethyl)glutathione dehydrogenase/alcohol dehydrogenase
MKAAVMRAIGAPLQVEDIQLDAPGPREVVVRTVATGVCHSDLHVLEGALPNPLPTVLGHEFVHLSAFAERMLVHENALVPIRRDVPLDRVALIGCGVTTGLGAVFHRARVGAGTTAAVIGCGGIGLSVVQGCRIAGAARIVAIDTMAWKLDLAARLGATDVVNAAEGNPVPRVVELTSGGVDYAFEAIGNPATIRQAVRMTRKGGTTVMIGVVPAGTSVELPGADIVLREKTILGCMMGSNRFRVDMPRYVELYRSGQLRLDEMISARLPLEGVNDAFEAMRHGTAARSVIVFA